MEIKMKTSTLALSALMLASSFGLVSNAEAATMPTAKNGMTVYAFDKDKGGKPSCYGLCAFRWPPYLANSGGTMGKGWSKVSRKNGSMQWAFKGRPVYFYTGDHKAGDENGNGIGGIWHVVAG
jgi:predicted lipoprotein with Yx(FWY)xxD motif